jgi:predicted ATPase with chaperone activity
MLAKVLSSALIGIDAILVDVEVDLAPGLPTFATVGLPDGAVKESKDRVRAALKNSGYDFPARRITANLAPADIKKEGAAYDLPISIGILAAMNPCPCGYLSDLIHPCTCTPIAIHRYCSRISGPLLDRIDIHIEVPAVKYRELADRDDAESSAAIAARVKRSREIQLERYKGTKIHCNAQMTPPEKVLRTGYRRQPHAGTGHRPPRFFCPHL